MPVISYTEEDIKNAKINLANQKLTSFQSAILFQHIENLQQRIDKVLQIIKECKMLMPHEFDWEEQVDNIVSILQGEEVK